MTANVLHPSIYEQKQVDFCQSEASLVYSSEFQASQEYWVVKPYLKTKVDDKSKNRL